MQYTHLISCFDHLVVFSVLAFMKNVLNFLTLKCVNDLMIVFLNDILKAELLFYRL